MRKLIEVRMPLNAINRESAREKSIRHGHPSTLHLWWARRPLASARAVLFAEIVNWPGDQPRFFPTLADVEARAAFLSDLIEWMVVWEHTKPDDPVNYARWALIRDEIAAVWEGFRPRTEHEAAVLLGDAAPGLTWRPYVADARTAHLDPQCPDIDEATRQTPNHRWPWWDNPAGAPDAAHIDWPGICARCRAADPAPRVITWDGSPAAIASWHPDTQLWTWTGDPIPAPDTQSTGTS